MSLSSHVETLKQKHRDLEDSITASQRLPGSDHLNIVALKRQKLKIKEEIEKLSHSIH